jgi:hypothetical protein
MRDIYETLCAEGTIRSKMMQKEKHGLVLKSLGFDKDPPHGYGIETFVRNVLGKQWGRHPK